MSGEKSTYDVDVDPVASHLSNSLYPKLLLSVFVLVASLMIVNVTAQLPAFQFEELEIIEDPHRPGLYSYIFNFCDNAFDVEDPKFLIISDLEKRPMQLSGIFHDDRCYGAVEKIRANDPDSIRVELVTFQDENQTDNFEDKIAKQQATVDRLREELTTTMAAVYPKHQDYIDATKLKSDELWNARKQLQHLNAQYYEMMSVFHPEEQKQGRVIIGQPSN